MSVVSAAVEANGWVLAVTGYWPQSLPGFTAPVGPHAEFPLEPDGGAPKVVLTVADSAGHTRSGGQAVGRSWTRTLLGTKPLRRPFPESTDVDPVLDEVDLGGGLRRVRIALSDRVFAGETVQLSVLDGWRTGLTGGVVACSNSSTRVPVLPICRWATAPYSLVSGATTVRVDLLIASHYARHFGASLHQAVAGVRYRMTDGKTTKEQWVTEPSEGGADALLCWGATLDLSGLTAGVVSVSATVFPWIGAPREIGIGHPTSATAGFAFNAETVLPVCYDPDGERYRRRYVYLDTAGSTDPAAVTVATSLALAKSGTAAANVTVALQAMYLANVTLPAANGFAGGARSCDWWEIVLKPGQTHMMGAQAVTNGLGAKEGRLVVRGDPEDSNPRANCVLVSSSSAAANVRNIRWWWEDCQVRVGQAALMSTASFHHIHRVDVRGRAGYETATSSMFTSSVTGQDGLMNFSANDFSWRSYGLGTANIYLRPQLLRNGVTSTARRHRGLCLVNLAAERDTTVTYGNNTNEDFEGAAGSTSVRASDQIVWNVRSLTNNGRFYVPAPSEGNDSEATPSVYRRLAVVNCVAVRSGPNTDYKHVQIGENAWNRQEDCLWEGLTMLAQRTSFHNDPPNHSADLVQTGNVVRNCFFDRISSKSDTFPTASGNRTGAWEIHYGVGFAGLVVGERGTTGNNFLFEYYGRNHYRPVGFPGPGSASIAGFVDDRSNWSDTATNPGADGVGPGTVGDYRPTAGLMLLGAACNAPTDWQGMRRSAVPAVGSIEMIGGTAAVQPDAAAIWFTGGNVAVGMSILLHGRNARMPVAGDDGQLWMDNGLPLQPAAGRRLVVRGEWRRLDAGNG